MDKLGAGAEGFSGLNGPFAALDIRILGVRKLGLKTTISY